MSDSVWPHRQQPTRLPCPWDSPGKNTGVGCHFLLQCMKGKSESEVAQLCPAYQAPPSMGFSRQEYWSGVPLPSPKVQHSVFLLTHGTRNIITTVRVNVSITPVSFHVSLLFMSLPCTYLLSPGSHLSAFCRYRLVCRFISLCKWDYTVYAVFLNDFLQYNYVEIHPCWLRQQRASLQCRRPGFDPWIRKIPWRRKWQPTPIFLPGESPGQRKLAGYSPWDHTDLGRTERLTLWFSY